MEKNCDFLIKEIITQIEMQLPNDEELEKIVSIWLVRVEKLSEEEPEGTKEALTVVTDLYYCYDNYEHVTFKEIPAEPHSGKRSVRNWCFHMFRAF